MPRTAIAARLYLSLVRLAALALLAVAVVPAEFFASAGIRAGETELDAAPAFAPQTSSSAPRNPIDSFVGAAWRERRLSPSPPADRRTLLRRLSLDLRGLPLSDQELDELEPSRESPDAGAPDAPEGPDAPTTSIGTLIGGRRLPDSANAGGFHYTETQFAQHDFPAEIASALSYAAAS